MLGFLKDKYSFLFNWFGKISLELYLCSFHVWLAADSNGVLVLLPGYPVMNMLITSFIFLSVAHELHLISKSIAHYCVPANNWKICLRNFCCFLILLMPIAIKYGYIWIKIKNYSLFLNKRAKRRHIDTAFLLRFCI